MRRFSGMTAPLLWAAACVGPVGLSGCQGVAWLAAVLSPPPKVKAQYRPPKGKTIFVFVDDPFFVVTYEPVKGELTERINARLKEHKIAARTVGYETLLDAMSTTPDFNRLRVAEVGRKVGADIVLYVLVNDFGLKDAETQQLWQARMRVTVRVVDVAAGRLWPLDREAGCPLKEVRLPPTDDASPQYGIVATKELAERVADKVAKLFYDHREEPQGFSKDW